MQLVSPAHAPLAHDAPAPHWLLLLLAHPDLGLAMTS